MGLGNYRAPWCAKGVFWRIEKPWNAHKQRDTRNAGMVWQGRMPKNKKTDTRDKAFVIHGFSSRDGRRVRF